MFFVGLFGTNFKVNRAGFIQVPRCPCCGGEKPLHLVRKYQYLHAFFIPLYKFHSSYFATCPVCASVFEISDVTGRQAEQNGTARANQGDLTVLQNNFRAACPNCAALLHPDDHFCRNCGKSV